VLVNAFAQVLVVSVAEVIVCWALVGAAVESWLRPHTQLAWLPAAIAASVLFGLYHFAHSPPFDTIPMVSLLTGVGMVTSAFFFLSRDVYATIGGEAHDSTGYEPLMHESGPDPKVLLGDRGYDADPIREDVEARGGTPVIPTKRNRKVQIATDGFIYALRNRIERGINRFKNSRRVATRYDKSATSFLRVCPTHSRAHLVTTLCQHAVDVP
jgi:transposase